jgi:hypothetical protein
METMYCPAKRREWEWCRETEVVPTCYWSDVKWDVHELETWLRAAEERNATLQALGLADDDPWNQGLDIDIDEAGLELRCLPMLPRGPVLGAAERVRLSPESTDFAAGMRGFSLVLAANLEEEPE